jgi:peptidoglycan/LPS O-acetylase OafA/YrhL
MLKEKRLSYSEIHLDAMRGLAALVVVFGHGRGLFLPSFTSAPLAAEVVERGYADSRLGGLTIGHQAVMVFFVLSGYLVGGSVLNSFAADRWQWSDYLIKRLVRLWIVLVPAILIGVLIDNCGFNLVSTAGSIYSAPPGQEYVGLENVRHSFDIWIIIGNLLFLQGIFVPTAGTNLALWSLSNEFWYYLMFPTLLLVFRPNERMSRRIAFGLVVVGIAVLIGAHAAYLFLVWILGAIVAHLLPRIPSRLASLVVVFGALVFVGVFLTLKKLSLPLYVTEMMLGVLTALLIYAIKCHDSLCEASLYSRTSRFFSNISYTLYLTHLPFLIFVCAIVNSPWTRWAISPATLAEFAALMSLPVVWAWILYQLFESKTDIARRVVWAGTAKFAGYRSGRNVARIFRDPARN